MQFSPQQEKALAEMASWFRTGNHKQQPFFYLAGYAGTGKTTLARYLTEGIDGDVLFAAYTGKAALQLTKSGCQASTIHSLTYSLVRPDEGRIAELKEQLETATPSSRETIIHQLNELGKPRFTLNTESKLASDSTALLVLDECSMIDEDMAKDILSFGKPVLILGDPGQLPPVSGAGYFTSRTPDVMLTEIHRQARDNPIIALSLYIREHGTVPQNFSEESGGFGAIHAAGDRLLSYDQILCGKNATRLHRNGMVRRLMGFTSPLPQEGDKLIILRNDRERGLFNGLFAEANSFPSESGSVNFSLYMDFTTELGVEFRDTEVFSGYFEEYENPGLLKQIPFYLRQGKVEADYGYALTVHKAQGSQWPHVLVIDDGMYRWGPKYEKQRRQWLYTAVTRAQESVKVVRMRQ